MGNIAIKGHSTRGDEVINILERFGAKNNYKLTGDANHAYYVIENNEIKCGSVIFGDEPYAFFTVEEFLRKYPYSINDKVVVLATKKVVTIEGMSWRNGCEVIYETCHNDDCVAFYSVDELQPYEELSFGECIEKTINECLFGGDEETMEGVYAYNEINCYHKDFGDKVRIRLGPDFEIKIEDDITYIVKKQSQYPKTYVECCEIIHSDPSFYVDTHLYSDKLESLYKLLICRNAYWKIYGEQMGLGKPWKPDWTNNHQKKWIINFYQGEINFTTGPNVHFVLAFPSDEICDYFYNNFKDLINQCKELL